MAMIKVEKVKLVSRKVSLKKENEDKLFDYVEFLGLEKDNKEDDFESKVINGALEMLFTKDKEFKKFLEKKKKNPNEPKIEDSPIE